MKLLLDQNLSYRMLAALAPEYPGSSQVGLVDLDTADDRTIWQFAKDNGFCIVTLDSDFNELATLYGAPPRIIWLKCGNRPRRYVENLLLRYKERIEQFDHDDQANTLEVY